MASRDHNLPEVDLKDMEVCDLSNKDLKIAVLRKLSEL